MKKLPTDILAIFSSPEFLSYVELNVLKPILSRVFQYLYPYILAITLLWVIMFLCMTVILVILLRARK